MSTNFIQIQEHLVKNEKNLCVEKCLAENPKPTDLLEEVGKIYSIVRPILGALKDIPLIPDEWKKGLKTFIGLMDGVCGITAKMNAEVNMSTDVDRVKVFGKDQGWRSTGIEMKEGETAYITASGIISFGLMGSWPFGPEGEDNSRADAGAPAPGFTKNSLVAMAGSLPKYIGSSGQIKASSDCVLQIANNDPWTADNDGQWNVSIRIK